MRIDAVMLEIHGVTVVRSHSSCHVVLYAGVVTARPRTDRWVTQVVETVASKVIRGSNRNFVGGEATISIVRARGTRGRGTWRRPGLFLRPSRRVVRSTFVIDIDIELGSYGPTNHPCYKGSELRKCSRGPVESRTSTTVASTSGTFDPKTQGATDRSSGPGNTVVFWSGGGVTTAAHTHGETGAASASQGFETLYIRRSLSTEAEGGGDRQRLLSCQWEGRPCAGWQRRSKDHSPIRMPTGGPRCHSRSMGIRGNSQFSKFKHWGFSGSGAFS